MEKKPCTVDVEFKWSVWSANIDTWKEQAPDALATLMDMEDSLVVLKLQSRKEIRFGEVTITGTSEYDDQPGDLTAIGRFEELWDEIDTLADTLGIDTNGEDYDRERAILVESLPFANANGDVGVYVEFDVRASSVAELLKLIDAKEDEMIEESSRLWKELDDYYKNDYLSDML